LFQDNDWEVRWFVINVGTWLSGRELLIHPTALGPPDIRQRAFPVALMKAAVEATPDISNDPPVFRQMEQNQKAYYAYSPVWASGVYSGEGLGLYDGMTATTHAAAPAGDPHLRSLGEVVGYHIAALDGDIGHLEDFLLDDETWRIEFAVVDTSNWGFGKHVLVAPKEIKSIDWSGRSIGLELTRYNIKSGPSWQEPDWSERPAG
jgi:hypothetical protein